MTEEEWLGCSDPQPMLEFLRGKVSERQFRLLLVGSCRRLFHLLPEPYTRKAIRTAERYADGDVSSEKLRHAWGSVRRTCTTEERLRRNAGRQEATAHDFALWLADFAVEPEPVQLLWRNNGVPVSWWRTTATRLGFAEELDTREPDLLRDIFGNPFHPATLDPAWRAWNGGAVTDLARAIYEDRAFDRLPVLADALEEAGCTRADILAHCRGPGPHVRGCWVLDLLLSKDG